MNRLPLFAALLLTTLVGCAAPADDDTESGGGAMSAADDTEVKGDKDLPDVKAFFINAEMTIGEKSFHNEYVSRSDDRECMLINKSSPTAFVEAPAGNVYTIDASAITITHQDHNYYNWWEFPLRNKKVTQGSAGARAPFVMRCYWRSYQPVMAPATIVKTLAIDGVTVTGPNVGS